MPCVPVPSITCPHGFRHLRRTIPPPKRKRRGRKASLHPRREIRRQSIYLPQHFLNFLPLPQGQGSLRPTLGASRRNGSCPCTKPSA